MEEFYQSFIDYIEANTRLTSVDSTNICMYTGSMIFITKNLPDKHHYHVSLIIKFSNINDMINAAAEIIVESTASATGVKPVSRHKRVSMLDFNELVKRGSIVELCDAIADYEFKMTEAETNFLLNCEILLL